MKVRKLAIPCGGRTPSGKRIEAHDWKNGMVIPSLQVIVCGRQGCGHSKPVKGK